MQRNPRLCWRRRLPQWRPSLKRLPNPRLQRQPSRPVRLRKSLQGRVRRRFSQNRQSPLRRKLQRRRPRSASGCRDAWHSGLLRGTESRAHFLFRYTAGEGIWVEWKPAKSRSAWILAERKPPSYYPPNHRQAWRGSNSSCPGSAVRTHRRPGGNLRGNGNLATQAARINGVADCVPAGFNRIVSVPGWRNWQTQRT